MSIRRFTFVERVARDDEKLLANEPVACGATPKISEVDTGVSEGKCSHVLTAKVCRWENSIMRKAATDPRMFPSTPAKCQGYYEADEAVRSKYRQRPWTGSQREQNGSPKRAHQLGHEEGRTGEEEQMMK